MGWFSSLVGGAVGFLIGGPAGAVIGAGLGATKVGEKVVDKVLDFVTKPFMNLLGVPDVPTGGGEAQRQQGVLLQRQGGNEAIPVIYGYRAVGGTIVYAETGPESSTPANKYLWVAYVFTEGPVEGLKELHIDDNQFPESICARLNAGETVTISGLNKDTDPAWKYNDKAQFRWFPGTYYNTPTASPIPSTVKSGIFNGAPNFTDDMYFNGVAVLFARYEKKEYANQDDANNDPYGGGIPTIRAGIMGRKVVGLTDVILQAGAVNAVLGAFLQQNVEDYWANDVAYNQNAGRYSTNPAECLFDYLRNPRYGKGLLLTDFDKTSWVRAANKCNQRVTYYTGAVGPILTCNFVLPTDQTIFQNTKNMLTNFRAYMPYVQGKYKLRIEDAGNATDILSGVATIVQTITKDDIVGDVTYTGIERTSKYNHVTVTYVDPDQKWSNQEEVWPTTEAERQVFITEDGGRENKGSFTFSAITNRIMARDMARLIFNKSRYQESCSFKMAARGFELEPGDNIRIQSNILNFGETPWRVISTTLNSDYTFNVGCVRNPDNIYPYGRYNEPDIVRPTFVPRQNEVYLPRVNNPLVGIFPPSYAPMPGNWSGTVPPGNLTPTNPTNPGDGTNPGGGSYDGTNQGIPVEGNGSRPPVIVEPINHVITYTGAIFDSATRSWTVTFTAPNTLNYAGVKFWYKQQGLSSYLELPEINSGTNSVVIPGATTTTINLLVYEVIARVRYRNGDYSTRVNKANLTSGVSGFTGNFVSDYQGVSVVPSDFTNLNADPHVIFVKNTGGVDTPKTLEFKITERPSTTGFGSTNIQSIQVYYRLAAGSNSAVTSPYYSMPPFNLPDNYSPYQEFTFKTPGLFGTTTETLYDLIFKFKFKNGSIGNKQVRVRGIIIRNDTSGQTNVFSEPGEQIVEAPSTETTNSISKLSVISIEGGTVTQQIMKIFFWNPAETINGVPPSVANFAGVRVEVAKLESGRPVSYTTVVERQVSQMTLSASQYRVDVPLTGSNVLGVYSVVITARYFNNSGVAVYSTHAKKYLGNFVSRDFEFNQINPNRLVEQNAPGTLYSIQKGDAGETYSGQTADKKIIIPTGIESWGMPHPDYGASPTKVPQYVPSYRMTFNIPTDVTFEKVRVYRRLNVYPSTLTRFEWTDITVSNTVFRYAVYDGELNGPGYNFTYQTLLSPNNTTCFEVTGYGNEIYLRLFYNGGTASKAVTRLVPTNSQRSVNTAGSIQYAWNNVMPATYNIAENIFDLDLASNLLLKNQLQDADARVPSEQRPVWYRLSNNITYSPGVTGYQGPFK